MKNIKPRLFLIFIFAVIFLITGLYGCAGRTKYFKELKASYSYDKNNGVFIKYPSKLIFEPEELLSYDDDKKTQVVEYKNIDVKLPKRNYETGKITDYYITIGYTVYNGKIICTETPMQYAPYNFYILNNSTDSVIVTIDEENAFLVNLNDASSKKLFNDGNINNYSGYFVKDALKKLIYAQTISVSPDGRYILYISSRNYMEDVTSHSLDIYFYDMQTGLEEKIMNYDHKEFLSWEKSGTSGDFLFRETGISPRDGKKVYSDIMRYSISTSTESLFFDVDEEKYSTYEPIDEQFIYTVITTPATEETALETNIYIQDIYSGESFTVNVGNHSMIWHVSISETKEYLALFGSYLNQIGIAVPEILTVNIKTNDVAVHYDQSEGNYFIDSFYWCNDNVLAVNFINTTEAYKDLCRLHNITH